MRRTWISDVAAIVRSAWDLRSAPLPGRGASAAVVAGGIVLVLAIVAGQALADPRPPAWAVAVDLIVGLGGAAALPLSLQHPLRASLGFVLLSLVSPAATPLAATALLWLAQRAPLGLSVAVAGAGVLAQVARGSWRPDGDSVGWWLAAVGAGFAAVVGWGAWSSAHHQLLQSLVERARRAEEQQAARVAEARRAERESIAREMHDVLAHRLSLLATYAGAVEYNRQASPERLEEAAGVIRAGAHDALEDLRAVIDVLRSESEEPPDGGSSPPQPALTDVPRLVDESRRAGVQVDLDLLDEGHEPADVPSGVGRAAYRVVQEALTNARKHAPGRPVRVAITGRPGHVLSVEVRNGLAGEPAEPAPGSGTGLIGMAERVRLAGGDLEAGPTGTQEFRVHARLPWPA
jgi:signal transduction histidine kinase